MLAFAEMTPPCPRASLAVPALLSRDSLQALTWQMRHSGLLATFLRTFQRSDIDE